MSLLNNVSDTIISSNSLNLDSLLSEQTKPTYYNSISAEVCNTGRISFTYIENGNIETRVIDKKLIVGASFNILMENLKESSVGYFVLVLKKSHLSRSFWKTWVYIGALSMILYFTLFVLLGAWSSLVILVIWLCGTLRCIRGNYDEPIEHIKLQKMVCFYSIISFLALSTYVKLVGFEPHSCPKVGSILSLIIGVFLFFFSLKSIQLPPPPNYHFPLVLMFHDENISQLVLLRKQFFQDNSLQIYITKLWCGGIYIEALLSIVLPHHIYNSPKFRYGVHVLMDYLLPVYTVMRGFGALIPQLESIFTYLLLRTKTDIGLGLLWYMTLYHGQIVSTRVYAIIKPLVTMIPYQYLKQLPTLVSVQFISTILTSFQKLINILSFYLLPDSRILLLFHSYLQPIYVLLQPVICLMSQLAYPLIYLRQAVILLIQPLQTYGSSLLWDLQSKTMLVVRCVTPLLAPLSYVFTAVVRLISYCSVSVTQAISLWFILGQQCLKVILMPLYVIVTTIVQLVASSSQSLSIFIFQWFAAGQFLLQSISRLLYGLVCLLSQLVLATIRIYHGIFVKPMPVPNLAQVTTGVVNNSVKLLKTVAYKKSLAQSSPNCVHRAYSSAKEMTPVPTSGLNRFEHLRLTQTPSSGPNLPSTVSYDYESIKSPRRKRCKSVSLSNTSDQLLTSEKVFISPTISNNTTSTCAMSERENQLGLSSPVGMTNSTSSCTSFDSNDSCIGNGTSSTVSFSRRIRALSETDCQSFCRDIRKDFFNFSEELLRSEMDTSSSPQHIPTSESRNAFINQNNTFLEMDPKDDSSMSIQLKTGLRQRHFYSSEQ